MYKAIFIDIDGTLRNDNKEISKRTKEMIKDIVNLGILVIICSGRPYKTTIEISKYKKYYIYVTSEKLLKSKKSYDILYVK